MYTDTVQHKIGVIAKFSHVSGKWSLMFRMLCGIKFLNKTYQVCYHFRRSDFRAFGISKEKKEIGEEDDVNRQCIQSQKA